MEQHIGFPPGSEGYLLADKGYPLLDWIITPFRGRHGLNSREEF